MVDPATPLLADQSACTTEATAQVATGSLVCFGPSLLRSSLGAWGAGELDLLGDDMTKRQHWWMSLLIVFIAALCIVLCIPSPPPNAAY